MIPPHMRVLSRFFHCAFLVGLATTSSAYFFVSGVHQTTDQAQQRVRMLRHEGEKNKVRNAQVQDEQNLLGQEQNDHKSVGDTSATPTPNNQQKVLGTAPGEQKSAPTSSPAASASSENRVQVIPTDENAPSSSALEVVHKVEQEQGLATKKKQKPCKRLDANGAETDEHLIHWCFGEVRTQSTTYGDSCLIKDWIVYTSLFLWIPLSLGSMAALPFTIKKATTGKWM
ncbi:unnamed protein product [Amoebophrya sp. A25]|nr:unnamed protein product [Amoebophrya sp. A25]|eukprot:GSA25T00026260001.1